MKSMMKEMLIQELLMLVQKKGELTGEDICGVLDASEDNTSEAYEELYVSLTELGVSILKDFDDNSNELSDFRSNKDIDLYKLYLSEVGRIPMLDKAREEWLWKAISSGDKKAAKEMVESNLRLVVKIARNYEYTGAPILDLIQGGNLGLIEAVDHYDRDRGFKFSTYAVYWIRKGIRKSVGENKNLVTRSSHYSNLEKRVKDAYERLTKAMGHNPEICDIAEELAIPFETVKGIVLRMHLFHSQSLDQCVGDDDKTILTEIVADDLAADPCDELLLDHMRVLVNEEVHLLDDQQEQVIRMRYGLNDAHYCYSVDDIANQLGIRSRERVRRIARAGLRALANSPRADQMRAYW